MKKRILVIAQTPPPYHGQAIMQKYLVDVKWDWCEKIHLRLNFSKKIDEVAQISIKKLYYAVHVISQLLYQRFKGRIDLIYYPPAGLSKSAFYRDILILPFVRLFSSKIIFHFHSGGFSKMLNTLNGFTLKIAKLIYSKPAAAIILLPSLSREIEAINPSSKFIVSNGLPDKAFFKKTNSEIIELLYLSNLLPEKGLLDLISSLKELKDLWYNLRLTVIGAWTSAPFKKKVLDFIQQNDMDKLVVFKGTVFGEGKYTEIAKADIFCFPSYEQENQPLVLIEAMMFGLPIITTKWRALPDMVRDGENGFLVDIKSPEQIADKIKLLVEDKALREKMGRVNRKLFLENYEISKHLNRLEEIFKQVSCTK